MMPDARRLKRGLKDISPLFDQDIKSQSCLEVRPASRVQSMSAICPGDLSQNAFLNLLLASKMQSMGTDCAVISVNADKKSAAEAALAETHRVKRFVLSLSQFESACGHGAVPAENFGSSIFCLDFNYANPLHFRKVMPMLDKWVLFIQPQLESLSESFKFIKASVSLNRNLEYYAAYYGPDDPQKAALLYERFSDIISRRLGIGVSWLGGYDSKAPMTSLNGLAYELLRMNSASDSLEKRALTGLVYPDLRFNG